MAAKSKAKSAKSAKRGSIGTEIFEQVERMVAADKIGRTEAFRRVATKSGRQQGTVAANYYRVARQRGTKLAPRRRRGEGGGTAGKPLLKRAIAALGDVAGLFRKLEEEILHLRKENERLVAIRRLMR